MSDLLDSIPIKLMQGKEIGQIKLFKKRSSKGSDCYIYKVECLVKIESDSGYHQLVVCDGDNSISLE